MIDSPIVHILKRQDVFDVRLTHGGRWMVWADDLNCWEVREVKRRKVITIYSGTNEQDAVDALIKEE